MSPRTELDSSPSSNNHFPGRLVAFLVLTASSAYLCRVDVTVVAPRLMAEFQLSQAQMGELFSAFLVGYTAFQIPSGWVADRMAVRPLFLALALGWALVTAALTAAGWSPSSAVLSPLLVLLLLRLFFGILAAPTYPAAGRAIAVHVPARLQGRANGFVLASIGIGSAVTPLLLGPVSVRWGWRPAVLVAASLAALTALLWWLAPPEAASPLTRQMGSSGARKPASRLPTTPWPSPLSQRSFWFLAASYTLQGYVGYVFVFWIYIYLVQVRHFDLLKAAWLTALPWVCTLIAIPLGGVLSDWAAGRWGARWGRRAVPMLALVLASALLTGGARADSAKLAVLGLTLSTALVLSSEGPFWASMNQLSGPHSGTGGGVMNFGSNFGGVISPIMTPWLATRLGWGAALSVTSLLAVLSALLWLGVEIGRPREDHAGSEALPS